jgi:hypothetical protein
MAVALIYNSRTVERCFLFSLKYRRDTIMLRAKYSLSNVTNDTFSTRL